MHILYFTDGGNIHDYRFLTKMREKRYDVSYVYLFNEGRNIGVDGLDHYHLAFDAARGRSKPVKMWERWRVYKSFRALVRRLQPDVLHATWIPTHGVMSAMTGYHPLLLMPWGSDVLIYPHRNLALRLAVRFAIRRADRIICNAASVKQEIARLARYPSDQIITFPWGVDLSIFKPDQEKRRKARDELGWQENPIIIMTRRMSSVYRVEDFVNSLPRVLRAVPETRVLLVGSGPLRPRVADLIRRLGISQYVRLLGEVPNVDVSRYLNASDLYVSTSLSDGTSVSLLEAFACGLPVVVTDVPANLEWVEESVNGSVVSRGDFESIAEGLIRLLLDSEKRFSMGERNLELAQARANWDRSFENLEHVYQELARVGPHSR